MVNGLTTGDHRYSPYYAADAAYPLGSTPRNLRYTPLCYPQQQSNSAEPPSQTCDHIVQAKGAARYQLLR